MTAEIASTLFITNYASTLAQSMDQNQVDVLVLTPNQYLSILQDKAKHDPRLEYTLRKILGDSTFGQYWNKTISPNAGEPWVGPVAQGANDVILITKTLNAIGMAGITTYVKSSAAGTYIIIKGYAANRGSALQGTRYLATNPKDSNGPGHEGPWRPVQGGLRPGRGGIQRHRGRRLHVQR